MDFKAYFLGLTKPKREAYAKRAKTSVAYIEGHLIRRDRTPRKGLLERLASASLGNVSHDEVLAHFHPEPVKRNKPNSSNQSSRPAVNP